MDTHTTHHKIKAEWTRSSTNAALEESNNKLSKNEKTDRDKKCVKIKILEQIVLKPRIEESHNVLNINESPEKPPKSKKINSTKTEETRSTKKCQICEKSFPTNTFESHVKSHSLFECTEPDCFKKFKRKSSLRKHMYIHKGKFKYECSDCSETFIDKCKYQIHIVSKHKRIDQIYECKECNKTFTSADYLRRHQITHKDEFPYPCNTCHQKFKWFTSLQTHNMIHTQNKTMVQCKICFKRFFTQRTLDRHTKIHQNVKYHCKVCNSIASIRKDNILRHIRHLHNEIPRTEISNYVLTVEEEKSVKHSDSQQIELQGCDEIEITDDDYDDESNDLIIDDSEPPQDLEAEIVEVQQPVINNRVNVIQSIGNPHKNQQQTPQNNFNISISTEKPIDLHKTDDISINQLLNDKSNKTVESEKIDNEIKLPPKKKAIAKYNPIEHYRKILGLSEINTSSTSKESEKSPAEQVFPDHWRKRTSQNFLFRR